MIRNPNGLIWALSGNVIFSMRSELYHTRLHNSIIVCILNAMYNIYAYNIINNISSCLLSVMKSVS